MVIYMLVLKHPMYVFKHSQATLVVGLLRELNKSSKKGGYQG